VKATMYLSQPVMIIESDSSHQGWGARCGDTSTGESWSIEETVKHINFLELTAAFLAIKTFVTNQTGTILFKMDNISTVRTIRDGHTQSNCAT